jgi:RNA polymerase sigma factor (sigma-70 family)
MTGNQADLSDAQLWQLFKKGNQKAVAVLMDRYYSQLYYYGLRLCHQEELAEDCVQELFVNLWIKRETLSDVVLVKPYLLKSVRRKLLRVAASEQQVHPFSATENYGFTVVLSPEEMTIQHQHSEKISEDLSSALNQLPPRQKEAIYLRFYENLSYEETAQVMMVTVPYLYELIHKATRNLRKRMTLALNVLCLLLATS